MRTAFTFVPSPNHRYPDHPEGPGRFKILEKRLTSLNAEKLDAIAATRDQIATVHTLSMIASIEEACRRGSAIIDYAPTYVTSTSFGDALNSAGGVITCTRAVVSGEMANAFAIIRPPGHHAEPERAMGFCLFNNLAIGVREALASGLQRVLIVDFDAHHGNGTQAVFIEDPRVAFLSTHQWGIYPGTGWFTEAPHAKKRIINVPMQARAGDQSYARVMAEIVKPLIESFRPQMLFVSAGFDAHWTDPITSLGLTASGYFAISKRLVDLANEACNGRILFVLEGGYDPQNVASCSAAIFSALTGDSIPMDVESTCPFPDPDPSARIHEILHWHGFISPEN